MKVHNQMALLNEIDLEFESINYRSQINRNVRSLAVRIVEMQRDAILYEGRTEVEMTCVAFIYHLYYTVSIHFIPFYFNS